MDKQPPLKKWDIKGFAIAGAACGLIVGVAYETSEVFFHDPSEIEPFIQIIVEIGAAALGGSGVFAVFSAILDRLKQER